MPSLTHGQSGPTYWRSLDELADTPEFRRFLEAEFPSGWHRPAAGGGGDGPTRRQFLKLMGASLALSGLTGCRWPKETIVPATRQPVDRIPGVPVQYATAMELGGVATGLLVTSYDGRPIKIEGNDKHPFSRGKTNALMQASILKLYDPDRSRCVVQREWRLAAGENTGATPVSQEQHRRTWKEFEAFARGHLAELRATGGAGLCVLSEASSSPSLADMKARFLKVFPQARWCEYEPLAHDNEIEGSRLAFGTPYRTHLHLDRANVIVSLDSDFLMTHPAAVRYAGDFAARRRADDGTMNRLYVFETGLTVTGSMADHRFAARASSIAAVIGQLQRELSKLLPEADFPPVNAPPPAPIGRQTLAALAQELLERQGRCVIVAGPRQPAAVHYLAHALNRALGNVGQTITYTAEPDPGPAVQRMAVQALTQRMARGKVAALLILGGNPVFNAPFPVDSASGFAQALAKVPTSLHLSLYDDETSHRCTWHLPRAHFLESWGDARAYDGTVSLVQPLIEPLHGGRTATELLALLSGDKETRSFNITRRTFRQEFAPGPAGLERAWRRALHDGVVAGTAWPRQHPAFAAVRSPVEVPRPGS